MKTMCSVGHNHKGSLSLAPEERIATKANISALRQMGFSATSNSSQFRQKIIHSNNVEELPNGHGNRVSYDLIRSSTQTHSTHFLL